MEADGYEVHPIKSVAGSVQLAKRGIRVRELESAISKYEAAEGVLVGTLIGVTEDGFVGSYERHWNPDRRGAFDEPLVIIPWVYILELLGRAAPGTTGEFLAGGTPQ